MSPRTDFAMEPGQVRAFLAGNRFLALSGHDPQGRLTARVVPFVLRDDDLEIDLGPDSPFDLVRDPYVCAVVDTYRTYADIKGVIVRGRARAAGPNHLVRLALDRVTSFDFRKEPPIRAGATSAGDHTTRPSE